ncbi:hypothetical protein B0J13DRAFT_43295 [Dactylonectria estremocensis]|uniref:Uncharacterized protein n=1 Tax=Dactylonectria estremocensis TaxID=1079267 RepID=A0A9P9ESZ0_9HYPO|nr:hypothetical protein B0J13DRAFT_43295 [Dactylonectria estremocensis]
MPLSLPSNAILGFPWLAEPVDTWASQSAHRCCPLPPPPQTTARQPESCFLVFSPSPVPAQHQGKRESERSQRESDETDRLGTGYTLAFYSSIHPSSTISASSTPPFFLSRLPAFRLAAVSSRSRKGVFLRNVDTADKPPTTKPSTTKGLATPSQDLPFRRPG